ncbi:MAG: hypothetical protein LT071_09875 [Nocardioides sp.]|nr:hypothetical protein [Nocardioides sp.]
MANHGSTPAAWIGVGIAMVGFVLGSVALVNSPVNQTLLWIGIVVALLGLPVFLVLAKMGFNPSDH